MAPPSNRMIPRQRPIAALALRIMLFALVASGAQAEQQPSGQALKLLGLTINAKERCVDIEATVCLNEGSLELVACTKAGKVHESVVYVEARPIHIHTALLLIGAKNGNPAIRRPLDEEMDRWVDIPPKGDLIDVFLEFKSPEGKVVERPISDFIARNNGEDSDPGEDSPEAKKAPRFPHTFVFAGSQISAKGDAPKEYLADRSGHIISISTFGDELLCLPEVHSQENSALMWKIDPTHLPKRDTKVTLRLRLQKPPHPRPKP